MCRCTFKSVSTLALIFLCASGLLDYARRRTLLKKLCLKASTRPIGTGTPSSAPKTLSFFYNFNLDAFQNGHLLKHLKTIQHTAMVHVHTIFSCV